MGGMLPPSKLGALPQGLLSFFGIKSMGQYPQSLRDDLMGMMDLTRWYADVQSLEVNFTYGAYVADQNSGSRTIAATQPQNLCDLVTAGELQVPQNELWLVLEAATTWLFTAGTGTAEAHFVSGEITSNLVTSWPMTLVGFNAGNAAITRNGWRVLDRPFFVLPGHTIRTWLDGVTVGGGTVTVGGRLRLLRLQR